jgi:hypothetical protein
MDKLKLRYYRYKLNLLCHRDFVNGNIYNNYYYYYYYDVVLYFNDGHYITIPMEIIADKIERIDPDKLKEL